MITKFLVALGVGVLATSGIAEENGIWADGQVTYEHPNGQLVSRDCSLFVPSRGVGEVTLKCGDFSTSSAEFSTERVDGQVVFTVLFREMTGAPEGTVAKYRGSYLRGSNKALYYGDVFASSDVTARLDSSTSWQYAGGFSFSKAIGGERLESGAVRTVDYVDLNRYLGTWYEIASFPQSFQEGCVATTANYALKPNGRIAVRNECRIDSLDGNLKTANGTARVVDRTSNAKLKVTFFWPFSGDYWIIDLDPEYRWAVVGDPSREYLWILSRTPQLDETLYQEIVARTAREQGYDVSKLNRTLQPAAP